MNNSTTTIQILLADDDSDARFFFSKALTSLSVETKLTTIHNGHSLLENLFNDNTVKPDLIFLDFNMPGKNGLDCMRELKTHSKLKLIPVIIYSTLLHDEIIDVIFSEGAQFYLEKTGLSELKSILGMVVDLMVDTKFESPSRNQFMLNNMFQDMKHDLLAQISHVTQ